ARLPGDHRHLPRRRRVRDADQPAGGSQLRPARPEGQVSLMGAFVARIIKEKPLGAAGAAICLVFLLCGIFAAWLAPYGFNEINPVNRMKAPSLAFPLGTDYLGRDQLSGIIGFCAAAIATVISVVIGVVSGYVGGRADLLVQRFVDAWQSFPGLVILIVAVAVLGPGMPQVIGVLALLFGIAGSRIVRGAVVSVRENMYIHAAQSIGAGTQRILWRHVLPNVMPVVIVLFTSRLGATILAEAGLSFLGLGVPPPAPTWGGMLSGSARTYMHQGPWLAL